MIGYTGPIEEQTVKNTYFRQVLFTGKHAQLVVMSLRPGEEIGNEVHPNVDQFFRIEQGEARFVLDQKEERVVRDGDAVVVPAGTYHNVINASKTCTRRRITRMGRCTRLRRRPIRPRRRNTIPQVGTSRRFG